MLAELKTEECWTQFLDFISKQCSASEFQNWFAPIKVLELTDQQITLQVPNIFVREYLLDNYRRELSSFMPTDENGNPSIVFKVAEVKKESFVPEQAMIEFPTIDPGNEKFESRLNPSYTFDTFIEGPSNQFVKSAALGVAARPGKSYNPLFIHGGVGLGKTHLLHAIGHTIQGEKKKMRVQCITTEAFINDLVDSLRNKSVDKMKRFYRSLDVLIVDDIQFLQNRLNFEEEFCNTFESLINQSKQVIISSDKPPSQLKLSERLIARMEWGLVAGIGAPDFETRVAILQYKAESRGLRIPDNIAYFIAEHIYDNVRQLEGAINKLSAYCRLMGLDVSLDVVERTLSEMFQVANHNKISVEAILKSVSAMFNVRISDLKGQSRSKEIALPRQVAMYLAKELINESLIKLASSFGGKTHSTLLHSWNKIKKAMQSDEILRRQVQMTKQNLGS
ncbi:MAG: chromosomal replication initiator protein DnaA [Rhabdochlamydiaceae bacterium]|nr:chromosomal replication initiator protein DnaA [Candidatus Amphrikana amoebophyrae]